MASSSAAEAVPQTESGVLKGHEGAVLAVRFNKDGAYCLTCGRDRTLRLWNPHRGLAIKTYTGHGRDVRDVAVSSDNSKLASCGGDRHIFYWDVQTGRIIRRFPGHDSEINDVEFNSECNVLVSGGYDCFVKVWDCRSFNMTPIQVIEGFRDSVTSIVVTQSEIVCGSVDGTIHTFDIRMGKVVTDHLDQAVTSVSLSNDGYCVLAGCLDSKLRLLDRRTGELLNEYSGHQNKIMLNLDGSDPLNVRWGHQFKF
ncbi:hypothetical protein CBR_g30933 [Chara braunii]|uniref:Uncharacterized protein n=1 Tax=Chara braunii TaxID=69332 RepID=A0A388LDU0_CHABU|nr:hypothetical protein CBR_g30933 [Chara braunii]|eukprot:GBG80471.1 hypothetical protein CBR_g30933 [Chara braunii]